MNVSEKLLLLQSDQSIADTKRPHHTVAQLFLNWFLKCWPLGFYNEIEANVSCFLLPHVSSLQSLLLITFGCELKRLCFPQSPFANVPL